MVDEKYLIFTSGYEEFIDMDFNNYLSIQYYNNTFKNSDSFKSFITLLPEKNIELNRKKLTLNNSTDKTLYIVPETHDTLFDFSLQYTYN